MNKIKTICVFVISLGFFYCCSTQQQVSSDDIVSILEDLNIKTRAQLKKGDNLTLKIKFIDNYYVDDESHNIVNNYLLYRINKLGVDYDSILIEQSYSDLVDINEYKYSSKEVEKMVSRFESNINLVKIVEFAFRTFDSNEILNMSFISKDTREIVPDLYFIDGGFWTLLMDYVENCPSNIQDHKSMYTFSNGVRYFHDKGLTDSVKFNKLLELPCNAPQDQNTP